MLRDDFNVLKEESNIRLDILVSMRTNSTRSNIKKLIDEGNVTVDGIRRKPKFKVKAGQRITVIIPPARHIDLTPQDIPVDIVYEDEDLAIINKARGMVVHPAPGNYDGTLVNALLFHLSSLSGINGEIRPGIVHRIDKDTTGLLVVAKNDAAHNSLATQIGEKTASRVYRALCEGNIKEDKGIINAPIGRHSVDRKRMAVISTGKDATTNYRVIKRYGTYTLVELKLETGRTHQIRVHLTHIKHPIVGDPIYGTKKQAFNLEGQLLHAYKLGLVHPRSGKNMEFEAPLPDDFEKVLRILDGRLDD